MTLCAILEALYIHMGSGDIQWYGVASDACMAWGTSSGYYQPVSKPQVGRLTGISDFSMPVDPGPCWKPWPSRAGLPANLSSLQEQKNSSCLAGGLAWHPLSRFPKQEFHAPFWRYKVFWIKAVLGLTRSSDRYIIDVLYLPKKTA